jgi:hypothetical protein
MADAFIFKIVFIFAFAYQGMEPTNNQITLPEVEYLQCSMSAEADEIQNAGVNEINIDQLVAIGKYNKTVTIAFSML